MIARSEWAAQQHEMCARAGQHALAAIWGDVHRDQAVREEHRDVPPIPAFPGKETGR